MLDIPKLLASLDSAMDSARSAWEARADRIPLARERLRCAADLPDLARRAERFAEANPRARLAWPVEPLTRARPAPPAPGYRVIAVDGSQIEPDPHEGLGIYLINVGSVLLAYDDTSPRALLASEPVVRTLEGTPGEGDLDAAMRAGLPTSRRTEIERMIAECERLAAAIEAHGRAGETVALLDGPLIAYWVIRLEPPEVQERAIQAIVRLHEVARNAGVALAGYISATRSADVVNLLRFAGCTQVVGGGEVCDACRAALANPASEGGCVPSIAGVLDRHLFEHLRPGERSPRFRVLTRLGAVADDSPLAAVDLFYLRTTDDVARVEVPSGLADLDPLHAVLVDQAALGRGYPLVLAEAHEQAVIRGADRQFFFDLVRRRSVHDGHPAELSPKARSKRQPLG